MENARKLWLALGALLVASFAVLLLMGGEIYRQMPPLPERVVAEDGSLLYSGEDIHSGRQVRQSIGGMQLGSTATGTRARRSSCNSRSSSSKSG